LSAPNSGERIRARSHRVGFITQAQYVSIAPNNRNPPPSPAAAARIYKVKYRLVRHDNGVFFWQDNTDPSQEGTLGTTDKQEAERRLDSMNDADFKRWRMLEGEWIVGDLVQLKSGGPVITINCIYAHGSVSCVWMRGNKLQTGTFSKAALQAPQPKKPVRRTGGKNPNKP
jgi:uncharacterized protein YodC (DUF2158 family)